jgi:hypothetical protein
VPERRQSQKEKEGERKTFSLGRFQPKDKRDTTQAADHGD